MGYSFRFNFVLLDSVLFCSVLRHLPLEAGLVQAYNHGGIEQLKEARTAAELNPSKLLRYGDEVQISYSIEKTFTLSLIGSSITYVLSGKAQRFTTKDIVVQVSRACAYIALREHSQIR